MTRLNPYREFIIFRDRFVYQGEHIVTRSIHTPVGSKDFVKKWIDEYWKLDETTKKQVDKIWVNI